MAKQENKEINKLVITGIFNNEEFIVETENGIPIDIKDKLKMFDSKLVKIYVEHSKDLEGSNE